MDFISLLVLIVVALSGASIVIYTLGNGISPSPTGGKVKRKLLQTVGEIEAGVVYELGSGWGTLALPIAARLPNARVIGYENSPVPYIVSQLRLALSDAKNLRIGWANFFKIDLSDAALVVCYQSPGNMTSLRPKLEADLPDTAIVISNTFAVPGWTPSETIQVDDMFRTRIYIYHVGSAKPRRPS